MNILTKFKDLLIESLKDNKKLILAAYAIFLVSFIVTAALSGSAIENTLDSLSNSTDVGTIQNTSATQLFIHNEAGGIQTYITSIFFGISAIFSLVYNGVNMALLGGLLANLMEKGWIEYILNILPHGIFEISALVIQSVAGILLFLFVWGFLKGIIKSDLNGFKEKASNSYEENKKKLIQSLVLMIFGTILLLIAAPIEAYVSVPLANFILGI